MNIGIDEWPTASKANQWSALRKTCAKVRTILANEPRCDMWWDAVVEVLAATADKNGIVDRAHARFLRACGKLAVAKGAANVSASITAVSDDMQTKPARAGVLPQLDAPLQAALLAFREHEGQQRRCTWTFTQDVLLLHQ
jgi:hypothetical protein